MEASNATFHWIYRECIARVDLYSKRVAENRDVQAASEYARWLHFSGIIGLLKENASPEPLKVDGALLQYKVEQLIDRCNDRFVSNKTSASLGAAELESVHEKLARMASNLELLAGQVCRLTNVLGSEEPGAGNPALGASAPGVGFSLPCLFITTAPAETKIESDFGLKFVTNGVGK